MAHRPNQPEKGKLRIGRYFFFGADWVNWAYWGQLGRLGRLGPFEPIGPIVPIGLIGADSDDWADWGSYAFATIPGKLNQKLKFLQFHEIIETQMEWRQGGGRGTQAPVVTGA